VVLTVARESRPQPFSIKAMRLISFTNWFSGCDGMIEEFWQEGGGRDARATISHCMVTAESLSEKSRQAGTYLREVRENGMGMIVHGVIFKHFILKRKMNRRWTQMGIDVKRFMQN